MATLNFFHEPFKFLIVIIDEEVIKTISLNRFL